MSDLADTLRRLRERAGWSQRELARRMGVGVATVSSVEAGRDPRLSTLQRFAAHLPGASARILLAPASAEPEPACPVAWRRVARHFGYVAERVTVVSEPEGWSLELEGLRGLRPAGHAVQLAWLAGACVGAPAFLREFEPSRPRASYRDEEDRHEFSWPDGELGYSFRSPVPRDCALEIAYPIEELLLSAPRPPGCEAAVLRVRAPDGAWGPEADIASRLHPTGVELESSACGRRVIARVPRPVVGLRYSLEPDRATAGDDTPPGRDAPAVARPPAPGTEGAAGAVDAATATGAAGAAVAEARRALGLSLREVAVRAGLTHRCVRRVESDVDPKASTLRALLSALPNLAPQRLIPAAHPPTRVTAREEWDRRAACFGFSATEYVKTVDVEATGHRTMRLRTRALEPLWRERSDLRLRVGLRRMVLHAQPDLLLELESDDEDVTRRRLEADGVSDLHELKFRGEGEATRFNYIRTYRGGGRYRLYEEEAQQLTARPPPHRVGSSIPVRLPIRLARLVVVFPRGYAPLDVRGHAWPGCFIPDEALMLDETLESPKVQLAQRGGRPTAELRVRRPVVGFAYSISWQLPRAEERRSVT